MPTVVDRFLQLNVWQRGSERAPHKPLLILLALGALARGELDVPFAKYEPRLRALLKEFGPATVAVNVVVA